MNVHYIVALVVAGGYVGYRYGLKAVHAVRDEVAKIEAEAVTDVQSVLARIKKHL